jgi:hypothetical protein
MKSTMKARFSFSQFLGALLLALALTASLVSAQAPSRIVGTITAISGATLTVKTDAGQSYQVEVPSTAALRRIAPGQKDLSTAATIQFGDLAVGDRALVKLDPDAPAGASEALQIIAVKQADVALKQQKDREEWQRRGTGGLVKSVDAASGVIVLTTGAGATAKTITVHTTKTTMLKRYAPDSVRFDDAQPAPIDAIHAGDQLRALGTRSANGGEIDAEEVVSGSFRNISGTITSLDTAASTLVVKDLATKKQVTIRITADAQMRRLPDRAAQMLAAQLKGSTGSAATPGAPGQGMATAGAPGPGSSGPGAGAPGQQRGAGQWSPGGQVRPPFGADPGTQPGAQNAAPNGIGGDPQQMLNRAPAIQLADLKKGEAVMLVATDGNTEATAITLLAGVQPLLEAPAASQNLLSNWSMGGGGAGGDTAQ